MNYADPKPDTDVEGISVRRDVFEKKTSCLMSYRVRYTIVQLSDGTSGSHHNETHRTSEQRLLCQSSSDYKPSHTSLTICNHHSCRHLWHGGAVQTGNGSPSPAAGAYFPDDRDDSRCLLPQAFVERGRGRALPSPSRFPTVHSLRLVRVAAHPTA